MLKYCTTTLPGSPDPPCITKSVILVHYPHPLQPFADPQSKGLPVLIYLINKLLGLHSPAPRTPVMHALALPPIIPCTLFGHKSISLQLLSSTLPAHGASLVCRNPPGPKKLKLPLFTHPALAPALRERDLFKNPPPYRHIPRFFHPSP